MQCLINYYTTINMPGFHATLFDPVGAHEFDKAYSNNLTLFNTQATDGLLEALSIFGSEYNTFDVTGLRNYMHGVIHHRGGISNSI